MKKITSCLVGFACVLSINVNATDLQAELKECVKETDSLKRLVCYDNVANMASAMPAKVAAETVTAAPSAVPANVQKQEVVKAVESTAKVDDRKPMDAQASFGAERKYIKKEQVDEVRFTVKSVIKTARGKLKVTFENGQIWQQKDTDTFAKYVPGEIAIIKRGVFDSFYMKKPNANRTIRVKRIK